MQRVASLMDVADHRAARDPRLPRAGPGAPLRADCGTAAPLAVARQPDAALARDEARRPPGRAHEPPGGPDAGRRAAAGRSRPRVRGPARRAGAFRPRSPAAGGGRAPGCHLRGGGESRPAPRDGRVRAPPPAVERRDRRAAIPRPVGAGAPGRDRPDGPAPPGGAAGHRGGTGRQTGAACPGRRPPAPAGGPRIGLDRGGRRALRGGRQRPRPAGDRGGVRPRGHAGRPADPPTGRDGQRLHGSRPPDRPRPRGAAHGGLRRPSVCASGGRLPAHHRPAPVRHGARVAARQLRLQVACVRRRRS
jgi:hypothetical protein